MTAGGGILLMVIARVPDTGLPAFDRYESLVLPLLDEHRGVLQRRLREAAAPGGRCTEMHLVWFPAEADLEAYRADERRTRHAPLMTEPGASIELFRVEDVA